MSTPHEDWPKTLEWIEKQAQDSLRSRFATAELIAKETQTTLTVLLAGVGGSAAYGAKIFDKGAAGAVEIAAAVTCAYLVVLAVLLVVKCMRFQSYPALAQEPQNLMQPQYSLDELRAGELENIGERIKDAARINDARAELLNRFRIAAAITPLLFAVVAISAPNSPSTPPSRPMKVTCSIDPPASSGAAGIACEIAN